MTDAAPIHYARRDTNPLHFKAGNPANFVYLHDGPIMAATDNKAQVTCPECIKIMEQMK